MLKLIQSWFTDAAASTLDLRDYPAYALPHPGAGSALSLDQAQQNLAYFQSTLSERQRMLREWMLAHQGPDPMAPSGTAYAKALKTWAKTLWTQLPPFAGLPHHKPWPDCHRSGAFIVYSLLGDLAASLGETIRHANPDWHWGLNLDATDQADDMATARRVVLLADLKNPTPEAREAVLDPESMLFAAYRFPQSVDFVHLDPWSEMVNDAITGGYHQT